MIAKHAVSVVGVGVFALALSASLAVWLSHLGTPESYLNAPPGQVNYVLAKIAGMLAMLVLSLQVGYGLSVRALGPAAPRWNTLVHASLGTTGFALLVAHVLLFQSAVALRTGHWPWQQYLPDFSQDSYRSALSIGAIGLFLFTVVFTAGTFRHVLGRAFVWIHRLAPFALGAGLVHGLLIGTESQVVWITVVYVAVGAIVLWLFVKRIGVVGQERSLTTQRRE